ncbi:MAG: 50S ribosomal protein L6 [Candidatus Omnitrophica bacterium]|nr:50S ribosomal protein L6 [Candidatus Omnitrophota bacterium]
MSRIGKRPVKVPNGVKVNINQRVIALEGPKGKLSLNLPDGINAAHTGDEILLNRVSDIKIHKMNHGLARSLTNNMVKGVTEGFSKELEIQGVGFKAQVSGKKLTLNLGFAHPIEYDAPTGVDIQSPKPTQIIIKGIDKQLIGEVAAQIRAFYKPEPYKGKGIRYVGEYVRKKAGKTVA